MNDSIVFQRRGNILLMQQGKARDLIVSYWTCSLEEVNDDLMRHWQTLFECVADLESANVLKVVVIDVKLDDQVLMMYVPLSLFVNLNRKMPE